MTKATRGLLFLITLFVVGSAVAPLTASAQHRRYHHHRHHPRPHHHR